MEVVHANRVTTLGQLAPSIAHKVMKSTNRSQQCAATPRRVAPAGQRTARSGESPVGAQSYHGKRQWSQRGHQPDRALLKKAPLRRDDFEINEATIDGCRPEPR